MAKSYEKHTKKCSKLIKNFDIAALSTFLFELRNNKGNDAAATILNKVTVNKQHPLTFLYNAEASQQSKAGPIIDMLLGWGILNQNHPSQRMSYAKML